MPFCSKCGNKVADGARFCSACGASLNLQTSAPLKFDTVKCPGCGSPVKYQEGTDHFICEFCGTDIIINDEATERSRVLAAESRAKKRDAQINMEYEEHQRILKTKDEIKTFIFSNLIFCIVAVLVLIYAVIRIVRGDFAGIDIILDAIILSTTYKITKRRKK